MLRAVALEVLPDPLDRLREDKLLHSLGKRLVGRASQIGELIIASDRAVAKNEHPIGNLVEDFGDGRREDDGAALVVRHSLQDLFQRLNSGGIKSTGKRLVQDD